MSGVYFTKYILKAPAEAEEQKRMATFANKHIHPLYNNN